MTNFTVDVASMDTAATTIHHAQAETRAVESGLGALDIPHGTFGRVPWLSDQLAQPYENHVAACTSAIHDIEASLGDLSDAVTTTANAYRAADTANVDAALEIERELYRS